MRRLTVLGSLAVAVFLTASCGIPRGVAIRNIDGFGSSNDSVLETRRRLQALLRSIDEVGRAAHHLPASMDVVADSNSLLRYDAWGNRVMYSSAGLRFRVTATGPDGRAGSSDDIWVTGQLGRNTPCEISVAGVLSAVDPEAPSCGDDATVLVLPLCSALTNPRPIRDPIPVNAEDTIMLSGTRLVRIAGSIDRRGREFGGLPMSLRSVSGFPRLNGRWDLADAWGHAVRYSHHGRDFEVRSAGNDGQFGDADDVVVSSSLGAVVRCEFSVNGSSRECEDPPPACGA